MTTCKYSTKIRLSISVGASRSKLRVYPCKLNDKWSLPFLYFSKGLVVLPSTTSRISFRAIILFFRLAFTSGYPMSFGSRQQMNLSNKNTWRGFGIPFFPYFMNVAPFIMYSNASPTVRLCCFWAIIAYFLYSFINSCILESFYGSSPMLLPLCIS